ncbi:hypothetical protein BDV93DRAFT_269743 [Ceratobasidium sp. AG-I]|nr:hypothetical protein BDV93DRAFT_269743 [Ceratobasidium sp. AG-I]
MQRCYVFHLQVTSQNRVTLFRRIQNQPLLRHYAATSMKATVKKTSVLESDGTAGTWDANALGPTQKPNLSLRVLGKLLNGPREPVANQPSKKAKNNGQRLRAHIRRIDGLVASLPIESAVAAVTYLVSSPSISESLRPRILAKASYSFLRHGHFSGALSMYRDMLSHQFAPPVSLVAAIYRSANVQSTRKAKAAPHGVVDSSPSLTMIDDRLLGLLLSTLESSKQPEVMEKIAQEHASRISGSCLTNPSVVASMIRGYHAAGQLDGCFAWFHRYRHNRRPKDGNNAATPYVCLMAASRKLDPKNTVALYRITKTLQADGVPLTIIAFNEVLASELQNRRFQRAFSLISSLNDNTPSLLPDAHTFSLFFDALWKSETGPRIDPPLNPRYMLRQMLRTSESNHSLLTIFNSNAALRYFVHIGDFQSAISVVDALRCNRVAPNALTIRWVLEEILKRCLTAFSPTASLELENWVRVLLGGLSRDHIAYTTHLLDVVRSTRSDAKSPKLTKSAQDALQLIHKVLLSLRPPILLSTKEENTESPVLSMIYDVLQVCNIPA